jgi:hypothetical protein
MWVCKNMANKAHDVTLISARASSIGRERGLSSNFNIIETIEPSWEGPTAEEAHYFMYKELLEKEYGSSSALYYVINYKNVSEIDGQSYFRDQNMTATYSMLDV